MEAVEQKYVLEGITVVVYEVWYEVTHKYDVK